MEDGSSGKLDFEHLFFKTLHLTAEKHGFSSTIALKNEFSTPYRNESCPIFESR
jgi:hypothetical protein